MLNHYLEYVGNNIANNGATFQGKSAMGNMGCVQSKMVAVRAVKPPLAEQLDLADEILFFGKLDKKKFEEKNRKKIYKNTCIGIFSFVIRRI